MTMEIMRRPFRGRARRWGRLVIPRRGQGDKGTRGQPASGGVYPRRLSWRLKTAGMKPAARPSEACSGPGDQPESGGGLQERLDRLADCRLDGLDGTAGVEHADALRAPPRLGQEALAHAGVVVLAAA